MPKIYPGATLTPHFRDFVPTWLARQPWYQATVTPTLSPIGYLRLEDPAGQVGIETHVLTDGSAIYQLPMTYRDAPLPAAAAHLIVQAEHSVLGPRWIYDAVADPVYRAELLHLVHTNGIANQSSRRAGSPFHARGHRLTHLDLTATATPLNPDTAATVPIDPDDTAATVTVDLAKTAAAVTIDVDRILTPGEPTVTPDLAGYVVGTWHPHGADRPAVTGRLAAIRLP